MAGSSDIIKAILQRMGMLKRAEKPGLLGYDKGITGGTNPNPNSPYTVPNSSEALRRDFPLQGTPKGNVEPLMRTPANDYASGGAINAALRLARQTGGPVPGIPDAPPLGTPDMLHHVSPFGHAIHTYAADLFNNYLAGNPGGGGGGSPLDVAAIVAASPVGPGLPGSGGTGGTGGNGGGGTGGTGGNGGSTSGNGDGGHARGGAIDAALRMARQAGGRASPVPEYLLEQQKEAQAADAPLHGQEFPSGVFKPAATLAELTGVPSAVRGAQAYNKGDLGEAAGEVVGALPLIGKVAGPALRAAKSATPYAVGAGLGMLGLPSQAGSPALSPDAEIAKLETEIAKHQQSIAKTIKDIAGTRFRGVGEEAGMARQKALEEATRPYNDAIAQAQSRISQIRDAGDEEKNALTRIERQANVMRKEETARGKPFSQTPVGEQWEKLGPLAPAAIGAGTTFLGRLGHGPKIGWKLPVAEGAVAGAASSNVPTGWDAFFSPVRNPERKGYETYGQELKLAQHPRADEWLDYAKTLPEYNPTREKAQEEFFDPKKAAERMAFGAIEGGVGAGTGLASAIGLERLGKGVRSLFGSRPSGPTGPSTPSPLGEGPTPQGSLGTAKAEPAPPPTSPNKTPPSASPSDVLPPGIGRRADGLLYDKHTGQVIYKRFGEERKTPPKARRTKEQPTAAEDEVFPGVPKKPVKEFDPEDPINRGMQRGGVVGQALRIAKQDGGATPQPEDYDRHYGVLGDENPILPHARAFGAGLVNPLRLPSYIANKAIGSPGTDLYHRRMGEIADESPIADGMGTAVPLAAGGLGYAAARNAANGVSHMVPKGAFLHDMGLLTPPAAGVGGILGRLKEVLSPSKKTRPQAADAPRVGYADGGNIVQSGPKRYQAGGVVHAGPIQHAADGGRTDTVPLDVAPGSYVIPADIISGIGQGDTTAGYRALEGMFGPQGPKPAQGAGGPPVPILAAGGEFVISPDAVGKVGGGDLKRGHEALDLWVKMQRRKIIQELSKLPGPAKD